MNTDSLMMLLVAAQSKDERLNLLSKATDEQKNTLIIGMLDGMDAARKYNIEHGIKPPIDGLL